MYLFRSLDFFKILDATIGNNLDDNMIAAHAA